MNRYARVIAMKLEAQPDALYPETRHAWRDIYTDDIMGGINKLLKLPNEALDQLRLELCNIAEIYITIAAESDLDMSYSERLAWLKSQVITPATRLKSAIDQEHWPKFEDWITPFSGAGHAMALREPLDRAIQGFQSLQKVLMKHKKPGVKNRTDYRYALVYDLTVAYAKVLPDEKPKRVHHAGPNGICNKFPQYVRLAAKPILGRFEKLDHQIQIAVQKFNPMKKPAT